MEAHSELNVYTCRVNFGGNNIGAVHENSFVLFVRLTCATFGSCSLKHRNSHFLSVEYL